MPDFDPKTHCYCGAELHYTDQRKRALVENIVAEFGDFVDVEVAGRTWRVQRHYIALHGLCAQDLPHLGFEEVVTT